MSPKYNYSTSTVIIISQPTMKVGRNSGSAETAEMAESSITVHNYIIGTSGHCSEVPADD